MPSDLAIHLLQRKASFDRELAGYFYGRDEWLVDYSYFKNDLLYGDEKPQKIDSALGAVNANNAGH